MSDCLLTNLSSKCALFRELPQLSCMPTAMLLPPTTVCTGKFECITMAFMTDLPKINGYNALMVIVDKFGKLNRLVPCRAGEGQLTAPQVA